LRTSERNRQIKKALSEEFGYKNVRVRGGRGTAYGWIDITIKAPAPHECNDWHCLTCNELRNKIRQRAWEILKKIGLESIIGTYYDDMGYAHKECIIEVELEPTPQP
jgi:hypothetical protein